MNPVVVANCLSDPRIAATAAAGDLMLIKTSQFLDLVIHNLNYKLYPVSQVINLGEESADTTTIGLVDPSFVEGLAVTVDYYEIEIEDVISSVSASRLINECYSSPNYPNASQ